MPNVTNIAGERKLRIILLEDDPVLHALLVDMIRGWHPDVDVVAVMDGDEAWRSILRRHTDVLITDELHPGMSGNKIIRRLANERTNCSVLWTSGFQEQDFTEIFAGLNHIILPKPFRLEELRQKLNLLLAAR